ncbi:MAG: 4-alpha-glucanotransferase [Pseudomonadales bacterium]|nr:4-alpha-glucanotransferase [Pseudomonadales bacterium]
MEVASANIVLNHRRSGVLLHPTSLPGPYINGVLDSSAYRFVDFLSQCGFTVWQILPLCPVFADGSPYNSTSAFAGNTELVSIHELFKRFFDRTDIQEPISREDKQHYFEAAFEQFEERANEHTLKSYDQFITKNSDWLHDFALFNLVKNANNHIHWNYWPEPYRNNHSEACKHLSTEYPKEYKFELFKQFAFFDQWRALKAYANEKGVSVFGDIPIFVSDNSADVWSHQEQFKLDEHGKPTVVAGVPPDYFSATGQRWGNPVYDWDSMANSEFNWWKQRLAHALSLYDMVRIDHFRGFCATWEIPAQEETAINGHWVKTPGQQLFKHLKQHIGHLPIVAEDLGIITEDVEKLRDDFGLPGMKILHFAFDSDALNPYLPHNHIENCVVYTGTHDNDTTVGWYTDASANSKDRLNQYLAWPGEQMPWPLIKSALSSVAKMAIIPMQDVLALDGSHRMNTPGTTEGNWQWRFQWHQISHDLSAYLASLNRLFRRN